MKFDGNTWQPGTVQIPAHKCNMQLVIAVHGTALNYSVCTQMCSDVYTTYGLCKLWSAIGT